MIVGLEETKGGFTRHPVAWTDVSGKVGPARWARPTISVAQDSEKLAKVFAVASSGPGRSRRSIDFAKSDAVVVTAGPRSSTGYELRVVRVTQPGNLRHPRQASTPHTPREGDAAITYPYLLLVVPKPRST